MKKNIQDSVINVKNCNKSQHLNTGYFRNSSLNNEARTRCFKWLRFGALIAMLLLQVAVVQAQGVTDTDGDGIPDVTDLCPTIIGIAPTGCPVNITGQNFNPFVTQAIVTPTPLFDSAAGGIGQLSMIIGNSGDDNLPLITGQEMIVTIVLSNGVPNNAIPLSALGGTFVSQFDWQYNPTTKTYTGVQNQTILDALNGGVGTISIDYKVTSNSVSTNPLNGFSVTITPPPYAVSINSVNDDFGSSFTWTIPSVLLTPDFVVTPPGGPTTGDLSTNDNPAPGSTYSNPPANPNNPSSCSPVVASNGTFTFTCTTPGEYNFLVPVCEPSPSTVCLSVPLQITVTAPPSPTAGPIANPDVLTTAQGSPVTTSVTANDACMNGASCTLSNPTIVTGPTTSGSTAVVNPNGTITFTPATGFIGKDSILYAVCDNQTPTAKCDSEWVYITVLPTGTPNSTNAGDDFATTPYGTALNGNVTTNDTDPEGDTQTVTAQTTTVAGKGTLILTSTGTYTFTPTPGYSGPVDFSYTTCDNGTPQACATGTIHILVQSNTQVLTPDIAVTTPGSPTTGDLSTNDTPIPGSTYSNPPANPNNPSTCSPVVASNGTFTFTCTTPGEYNFLVPVCEPSPSTVCVSVPLQISVTAPPSPTAGPIANPDVLTTVEDSPITTNVTANDACMNGASCTLSNPTIVTGPTTSGSTAVVNPNGTITFTPATGFTGKDSILYAVCDNQTPTAKCDSEWVYITVLPTGTPNSTNAGDDFATTPYGTALNGNVTTNDTDPEGDTQTVTAQTITVAGKGTLILTSTGTYTFTPTPGYSGPVDFPYTTCDNGTPQACATGTIHILVQTNTQVLTPDIAVTTPGSPTTGDLSTNDNPAPGSTYSNPPANPNNPSSCSPVVASNGTFTFTCTTPGEYNFLVPVCEPSPSTICVSVPLQITVTAPPSPIAGPIANPDVLTTVEGSPVTTSVTANDACMNGASCTLSNPTIVTGPATSGSTAVVNPNGTITFTPATGFTGKDSILYAVCDNQTPTAKCDSEWVYITVLPTGTPNSTNAGDDFATTPYGTAHNGNVTTNDTDPEGDTQTVTAQTTTVAGKGTLILTSTGTYTFTPTPGYSGPVDFPYTTCDNGTPQACATGTIHILVQSNTQVLTPDIAVTTPGSPNTGDLSTNDTPIPGSTYSNPPANPNNPSSCSPVVASNGTFTFTCTTPGEYNFLVPVCEPSPSTVCVNVPLQITVTAPPSPTAGPIANPDVLTTVEGSPVTTNVTANDACMNGASCTLSNPTIVTGPATSGSTATVNPNGTITFTPAPGFTGKDSILYAVCDNQTPTAKCDSEWVYITVLPTGTPNSTNAGDDFATSPYGTAHNGNVTTNDTDPEGDTQTVTAQTTTVAGKGTLILTSTGTYTFTPTPGYSGPVDFPYTTCDNGTPQACATGTIHILVQTNTQVLTPDIAVTTPGTPTTGDLSTNDTPIPGSTYSNPPANPNNPSSCSPVVASNGTYTFTCTTPGEYNFLVPVCEPSPSTICVSVPLQITVTAPPSPTAGPIANPDVLTTAQGSPVTTSVTANDACMNGASCTLSNPTIVTGPTTSGSTATVNPNGTITFTPAPSFTGKDSILYAVCDNQTPTAKCDSEWVYITVLPTGTPNSTNAGDDFATTPYGTALNGNVKTNDTDPEGNTQTVTAQTTTVAGKGTLTLTSTGTYTFTPTPGYSGPVDFPYTTCDNGTPQACATGTIHILVQTNTQVLTPDIAVTTPGTPTTGDLHTNDTPIPGSTYSNPPANPNNPSSCSPIVASNGTFTFTCTTPGEYNFLVPVCEPSPSTVCLSVPLQITVTAPPSSTAGPIANPDVLTTAQGSPVTTSVTANDACMNGASCTLSNPTIVTGPATSGSTVVVNPNGTITFTPASGFTGKDSILYAVCDNQTPTAKCDSEWVYITVLPTGTPNSTNAGDDFATTPYGTALNGNVTTNDTDPEGDTQTVTVQTTTVAGKGTLILTSTGTYTFTPAPGYSGPVDFPYTTCDNGTPQACATGTIHILVQVGSNLPAVLVPDIAVTQTGIPTTGNLNTNDTPTPSSTYGTPIPSPTNPSACAPVVSSNGSFTFTCTTPGEYNFMVPVCEPNPSTVCTNVPLQITVTNAPSPTNGPIANPDVVNLIQGTPITTNVTSNDVCMNGPTCTLSNPTIVTAPTSVGTTAVVNPNGTITITPAPSFTGKDSILYAVCDNQIPISKCDSEWVYITVLPTGSTNTTVANDDFVQTANGVTVSGNVKTNDSDPEGHTQSVTPQTLSIPGKGNFILAANGNYIFAPLASFVGGSVDIPYSICDNGTPQACASATLHILVLHTVPDLTPNITIAPNIMHGTSTFNVTVKITELNLASTSGLITVRIPKDSRITFTYNPALTNIGFVPVSNANWTYDNTNASFHIFKTSNVIAAGGFSTFGFVASFEPTNTDGSFTMTSTIASGSGSETKTSNNTDAELADYFHN